MIDLPSRARKLIMLGGAACTMYGGVVLWKDAVAGKKYEHVEPPEIQAKPQVENKVVIVTGANSGIGREIVYELAQRKAKVFMACRDLTKCEEERQKIVLDTLNKYVYCRKCDLADFQSIRDFVKSFNQQEQKCDVLVNNAGIMNPRPRQLTKDGLELQLQTNHTGPLLLTELLRPSLSSGDGGRVVYLTNLDYRKGNINFSDLNSDQNYVPGVAFNQSQLANMLTVRGLANELDQEKITVNAVYPGVCGTNIKRHMGVDKSITGSLVANPLLWFLTRSALRGAQTPVFACIDPSLEKVSGQLISNMELIDMEDVAKNEKLASKVLAVSRYWAGLIEKSEIKL